MTAINSTRRIMKLISSSHLTILTLLAFFVSPRSEAAPLTWTGVTAGSWHTTTNWSTSTVPTSTDDLTILGPSNAAGALTINLAASTAAAANSLNITNTAATSVLAISGYPTLTIGAGGITTGTGAVTIGVNGGTGVNVALGAAQTWNVGQGGLTFSNAVTSGAGQTLTKIGAGTLTYNGSGAAAGFAGGLILNNGTVLLDYVVAGTPTNLVSSAATLAFGGGTLTVKGKTGANTTSQTFAGVTVNAGGGQILGDKNGGTSTTIVLGALGTSAAGGSLLVGAGGTGANAPVITTTTNKDATTDIYGGRVVFFDGTANTGYNWASSTTATGPGTPNTLSAYSAYTALVLTGGVATTNYSTSAGGTLSGSVAANSLKIVGSGTALSLNTRTLTLSSGGLLSTGTTAQTISGTAGATRLTAGNTSGSYDLIVHQYNSGGLTLSAVIGDNSGNAVNLVKAGSGDLNIGSATNTYTGNTYVNAGRLLFQTNTNILGGTLFQSGGGQYFLQQAITDTHNYNLSSLGYTETGANTNIDGAYRFNITGSTLSGTVTLSGNSRIAHFGIHSNTISGQITGSFGIDFYGMNSANSDTNTFTLSNTTNNFTGDLSITNKDLAAAASQDSTRTGNSTTLKLGAANVIPNGVNAGNVVFTGANANKLTILDLNGNLKPSTARPSPQQQVRGSPTAARPPP